MLVMFDSNKRGWLIKLIEVVEEDTMDAIVEVEDDIAVEAIYSVEDICGSDTIKKSSVSAEIYKDYKLKHNKD